MHFPNPKTRAMYQNTPASSCQELAGICIGDAILLIFVLVFVVGLSLLTLGLNLRARLRSIRQDRAAAANSPPPYSSMGFPPSGSHDISLCKAGSDSPPLDPYHVVATSLDSSVLLSDGYLTHVAHPDRSFAPSSAAPNPQRHSALPCGVGLGFGSTAQTSPSPPIAFSDVGIPPPPPAYVQDASAIAGKAARL